MSHNNTLIPEVNPEFATGRPTMNAISSTPQETFEHLITSDAKFTFVSRLFDFFREAIDVNALISGNTPIEIYLNRNTIQANNRYRFRQVRNYEIYIDFLLDNGADTNILTTTRDGTSKSIFYRPHSLRLLTPKLRQRIIKQTKPTALSMPCGNGLPPIFDINEAFNASTAEFNKYMAFTRELINAGVNLKQSYPVFSNHLPPITFYSFLLKNHSKSQTNFRFKRIADMLHQYPNCAQTAHDFARAFKRHTHQKQYALGITPTELDALECSHDYFIGKHQSNKRPLPLPAGWNTWANQPQRS